MTLVQALQSQLFSVVRRATVGFLLPIFGCASTGWHRIAAVPPEMFEGHVQIWTVGNLMHWHDVWLTSDVISGIPDSASVKCDTCRVTLPLTQVDSILQPNPPRGDKIMKVARYPLGIAVLAGILWGISAPEH